MAIVKRDHRIENIVPHYDAQGEVVDVEVQVNYELYDDVGQRTITRNREIRSIYNNLTSIERTNIGTLLKRLKTLGENI